MPKFLPFAVIGIFVLSFIFIISRLIKAVTRRKNLIKNGMRVKAKVLSIRKDLINTGATMSEPFRKVTLQIEDESMAGEVITIKNRFYSDPPQEGDIINIIVDPENINNAMISPED